MEISNKVVNFIVTIINIITLIGINDRQFNIRKNSTKT